MFGRGLGNPMRAMLPLMMCATQQQQRKHRTFSDCSSRDKRTTVNVNTMLCVYMTRGGGNQRATTANESKEHSGLIFLANGRKEDKN